MYAAVEQPIPIDQNDGARTVKSDEVELATRQGDDLRVDLLWDRATGQVWVDVLRLSTGECFRIEAQPGSALEVYYHPFAFFPGAFPLAEAA
jgi:hypothetical protein